MSQEEWKFVNTFAPWLSAIGTLAAVLVSLRLARNKVRVSLTVSVNLKIIYEPTRDGYERAKDDYVAIEVVNTGETEATIGNIAWIGRKGWKKVAAVQNLDDGIYAGSKLPTKLKFGEEARYMVRVKPHWLSQVAPEFIGWPMWWSALQLRCVVWTSVGQSFKVRPSPTIRRLLVAEAKRQRNLSVP